MAQHVLSIGMSHSTLVILDDSLWGEQPIPIVPIFVNTYFPPNQPTPYRCYELGLMASGSPVDSGPRASLRIKGMVSHPLLLLARGFSVLWRKATPWMPIANLPARRASRASCSHP
ncbi:MAG: hypothetical protein E6I97_13545 [Chloroflexi bacterium]|nr:MAG: hypothetical protein E6I97_13545 [Chloroflexota bacterium]